MPRKEELDAISLRMGIKFVELLFVSRLVVGQKDHDQDQAAVDSLRDESLITPLRSLRCPGPKSYWRLWILRRVWRERGAVARSRLVAPSLFLSRPRHFLCFLFHTSASAPTWTNQRKQQCIPCHSHTLTQNGTIYMRQTMHVAFN